MKPILTLGLFLASYTVLSQAPELKINDGTGVNWITDIEYSPNGKHYALAGKGKTIKLYESKTHRKVGDISNIGEARPISFSPDGKYIATSSGPTRIVVYETRSGELFREFILSGFNSQVQAIAFNEASGELVISNRHQVYVFSFLSGRIKRTIRIPMAGAGSLVITASKDARYIAVANPGRVVKVLDIETEKWALLNGHQEMISSIGFNSDATLLATGSIKGEIIIWDLTIDQKMVSLDHHGLPVNKVTFSPDNTKLFSSNKNKEVKIIDIASNQVINEFEIELEINDVVFTPGKSTYLISYRQWLEVRELMSGEIIETGILPISTISAVAKNDFGNMAVARGNKIYIKHGVAGNEEILGTASYEIRTISLSPDGQYLLTGGGQGDNGIATLWETATGTVLKSIQEPYAVKDVYFDPSSTHFVISHYSSSLWKINSKKKLESFPNMQARHFSSKERKLLLKDDFGFTLWNMETEQFETVFNVTAPRWETQRGIARLSPSEKEIVATINDNLSFYSTRDGKKLYVMPHVGEVKTFDLSLDGENVVSADSEGIKLWSTSTGNEVYRINETSVKNLNFIEHGRYFVSTNEEGAITLWDTSTGKMVLSQYHLANHNEWVAVTPDGRFDGTPLGMELLHYVKNQEIIPLQSFYENYYTPDLFERTMEGEIFETVKSLDQISLPPDVLISNILDGQHTDEKIQKINVIATDKGGGVDEIRLYQNGKLVSGTQRGFQSIGQLYEVSLIRGANHFRAIAFNDDRIESIPDEITIFYDGANAASRLFTLTVGINNYKNPVYSLNYAKVDARSFEATLVKGSKTIFEEVRNVSITDSAATRSNILSALKEIQAEAESEDMFIFYYAGHGVMSDGLIDESEFFIVPYDVTQLYGAEKLLREKGISASEIQEYTKSIKAQKQLFVLDACQSGAATKMLAMRGGAEEKAIAQLARSTGTYWLMASGSSQFASEFETLGHGVYTYALLEGLKGEADRGSLDRKITVQELSSYLNDRVPELSEKYKGQAQYPNSYGFGQDFPLVILR